MKAPGHPTLLPLPGARRPRVASLAWLVLAAVAGTALGCAQDQPAESALNYSENAKREYERGVRALEGGNWEGVEEILNEVRRKYAYSRYARLAELRLADADFNQEKYAEAITGYKSFVHDYPNDPEVPYARYRIAKSQYDSVSQSALLPPLEERDLASVNDSLSTIRDYLTDFPTSPYRRELSYMLAVVMGLLARHELYVARFYLAEGNFKAAVTRVEYALKTFDQSGLEPEAMVLLGEIYMKQKERGKARGVLSRVLSEYPDSAFTLPARNLLALLGPEPKRTHSSPEPAATP
ncbi:MAG TPA: outer membrane protein assembly factor BamD [Polyangiaceae bacterium]|jgi:outer membrane protein assembly factor BamD|nr:outer membrane protein assembly factor BamD [Polyangiaceae bacterium]